MIWKFSKYALKLTNGLKKDEAKLARDFGRENKEVEKPLIRFSSILKDNACQVILAQMGHMMQVGKERLGGRRQWHNCYLSLGNAQYLA